MKKSTKQKINQTLSQLSERVNELEAERYLLYATRVVGGGSTNGPVGYDSPDADVKGHYMGDMDFYGIINTLQGQRARAEMLDGAIKTLSAMVEELRQSALDSRVTVLEESAGSLLVKYNRLSDQAQELKERAKDMIDIDYEISVSSKIVPKILERLLALEGAEETHHKAINTQCAMVDDLWVQAAKDRADYRRLLDQQLHDAMGLETQQQAAITALSERVKALEDRAPDFTPTVRWVPLSEHTRFAAAGEQEATAKTDGTDGAQKTIGEIPLPCPGCGNPPDYRHSDFDSGYHVYCPIKRKECPDDTFVYGADLRTAFRRWNAAVRAANDMD